MKEVNATELRVDLTAICNDILRTSTEYVVTRYGEKIARLLPYDKKDVSTKKKVF